MSSSDRELFTAVQSRLGFTPQHVNRLIRRIASDGVLPRRLALIKLAAQAGVRLDKFATAAELAEVRASNSAEGSNGIAQASAPASVARSTARRPTAKRAKMPNATQVFVVHGRNLALRDSMFRFLRALKLDPIEWSEATAMTKKGSPYVGQILDAAFARAKAVVVLLSPDDEAQLRPQFRSKTDKPFEKRLMGQPRPNVLFEAGMAFGHKPDSTIIVEVGKLREFSDVVGRHVVKLNNTPERRIELANRLETAGCAVVRTGNDWLNEGDFTTD